MPPVTKITDKLLDVERCEHCYGVHLRLVMRPSGTKGDKVTYRGRCPETRKQIFRVFVFGGT